MTVRQTARILKAHGVVHPYATIAASRRSGLRLAYACAMLQLETGGGNNVFGHDPTIFAGAGQVTMLKYLSYRRRRRASGNRLMQGVGPCQLTWWSTQDIADRQGGCWVPVVNMTVGFRALEGLIRRYGPQRGAAAYNGSGAAAEAYGRAFMVNARRWAARLS